ncbi:hypothetical protein FGO68_gene15193 [Halteria grandinella]|uniref:Uncharacterized protein n=1 Tax=Halteria grandinella TaxID=5974 RepID=A0A8J8NCB3_HALGN|nr:hypothetical protein FGO68_gene15193 [Halteria grandinella]
MNKEMKKSFLIEDAFQRIRSQTAITDVQEIVHKFLTREQTYAQLLQAVSEQERKLDGLRKNTEEKKEFIAKLQIEHNALVKGVVQMAQPVSKKPATNPKQGDSTETEIITLGNDIEFLEKELEQLNDRRKKIHLVSDQVGGWANRVVGKLNSQLLMNGALKSGGKHSLVSLFDQITDIVTDSLQDIISNQNSSQHMEDMNMTIAKDFLKDVENEEFFAKNFRVRPVSGVTGSGNEERQSEHISRKDLPVASGGAGAAGGEAADDEDKFNKMMNLEMEEQRKKIKTQRQDQERKKVQEQEKKDKAAAKKAKL